MKTRSETTEAAIVLLRRMLEGYEDQLDKEEADRCRRISVAIQELEQDSITQETVNLLRFLQQENTEAANHGREIRGMLNDRPTLEFEESIMKRAQECFSLLKAFERLTGLKPKEPS